MHRPLFLAMTLALAGAVHLEWHLARPAHHRLSLGWSEHWLFAAATFAIAGWIIVRAWPESPARTAFSIVVSLFCSPRGWNHFSKFWSMNAVWAFLMSRNGGEFSLLA